MNLKATPLALPGCFSAKLPRTDDNRGSFLKLFHSESFETFLPGFMPREIYTTTSQQGVLRGMHFQLPPDDHAKVVVCISGCVTDVLLELRPIREHGRVISIDLAPEGQNCVLIPKGVAHGFYAQTDNSTLLYLVETIHSPEKDAGILWNSFGHEWLDKDPILSDRDKTHPEWKSFQAPDEWGSL